ncbi:MAG TPA: ABC transporter ATP-binding protein [Streptosporangiaceae bacterium]|jgi:ATP-binding cassette subfamily B protein
MTAARGTVANPVRPAPRPGLPPRRRRGLLAGPLWPFLRPYSGQVAVIAALLAIQGAGNLYLPRVNADLIDNGITAGDASNIWGTGWVMLAITVGQCVIAICALYWAARASANIGKDLRAAVYARVQEFTSGDLTRFGAASLITRNTNDVQQVQLFTQMALTLLVLAPIICVGGLIAAVQLNAALSALLAVAIPLVAAVTGWLVITTTPLFRLVQARIDRITEVLREQITGVRVIRAFNQARAERQRLRAASADLLDVALRANRALVLATPALTAILNLACVAVLWFGGMQVSRGSMPVGELTAFLSYVLQILLSVTMALTMAILAPRAIASAERICQVLAAVPSVTGPARPVTPVRTGEVRLTGASYRYPGGGQPALRDLTLVLAPGTTTAIVGGTGSGKSTLLGLIPRLLEAAGGEVRVDGTDVRAQDPQRLRASIGLVPQEAFLFRGSVATNLRLGRPEATEEELWAALRVAQASAFVAALPGGLETAIGKGEASLSGGQRQRLAIARAVLRRPRIYLFDDCFAALDGATEARLRAALAAATAGATVAVAAQRVSAVAGADQIVVLDEGRIAGTGSHRQLLAHCAVYRETVMAQVGGEAMA